MTDDNKYEAQIEAMAKAWEPKLFSADGWESHCAASPIKVEIAREKVLVKARAAAEAIGLKPGCVVVKSGPKSFAYSLSMESIRMFGKTIKTPTAQLEEGEAPTPFIPTSKE